MKRDIKTFCSKRWDRGAKSTRLSTCMICCQIWDLNLCRWHTKRDTRTRLQKKCTNRSLFSDFGSRTLPKVFKEQWAMMSSTLICSRSPTMIKRMQIDYFSNCFWNLVRSKRFITTYKVSPTLIPSLICRRCARSSSKSWILTSQRWDLVNMKWFCAKLILCSVAEKSNSRKLGQDFPDSSSWRFASD